MTTRSLWLVWAAILLPSCVAGSSHAPAGAPSPGGAVSDRSEPTPPAQEPGALSHAAPEAEPAPLLLTELPLEHPRVGELRAELVRGAERVVSASAAPSEIIVEPRLRQREEIAEGKALRLQVALDGYRPVVHGATAGGLSVERLLPAGVPLEPGVHRIVAVPLWPDGATVKPRAGHATHATQILRVRGDSATPARARAGATGSAPEPPASTTPALVYSLPRGTYNGAEAADAVVIDFHLLGTTLSEAGHALRVSVIRGAARWATTLHAWRSMRMPKLESGDYSIVLQLEHADGRPLRGSHARVERTITVNRDAPMARQEP